MAHVAREYWQLLPQVFAFADPNLQTMHREGMSQIVHSGCWAIAVLLVNARPRAEAHEVNRRVWPLNGLPIEVTKTRSVPPRCAAFD